MLQLLLPHEKNQHETVLKSIVIFVDGAIWRAPENSVGIGPSSNGGTPALSSRIISPFGAAQLPIHLT